MIPPLRPSITLLSDRLASSIIDESFDVLTKVGVFIENEEAARLLSDHGAVPPAGKRRTCIPRSLVERCLSSTPAEVTVFDSPCRRSFVVGGDAVHFDPGSAALRIFDHAGRTEREPTSGDLIRYCRLVGQLDNFHFQSTGIISSDVPREIADSYRLYLGLQYCSKPIVTGTFRVESFRPMADMLAAVRGGTAELQQKPLAIFDACPSPPLMWSNLTAQSVIDCARAGIPSEFVAMPLTGATSPVTLTGALVQHTAENLSGLVIAQLARAGAPVIFGGSPSSFDLRTGHPPMGAIETMMIDAAYSQIGKKLRLPTHAYMGLSDAKSIDVQAGIETGLGTILAALAGINVVSGGGMLDFESSQSLEKLVIDNDICGMAYRLIEGIEQRDDPMALGLLSELEQGLEFLTHPHTLRWYRKEQFYPKVTDRGTYSQWVNEGKPSLPDRASRQVDAFLARESEPVLNTALQAELERIMMMHARACGCDALPLANERA